MAVTPSGDGSGWTEDLSVDEPIGLSYRAWNHLAKAVRKRSNKEHEDYGDVTAGGEHVPGYVQVLRQVDGTADVTSAYDNTLFQANGLVHANTQNTLWCITAAGADPTILLIDPDKQCKGADITWTGAHEFDASVDVSGPFDVHGAMNIQGPVDFSADCTIHIRGEVDSTHSVMDRIDFSSAGFSGDVTLGAAAQVDGTCTLAADVQVNGLMSLCANNVYDSTWFAEVTIGGTYLLTHDLSSTAIQIDVFLADMSNESGLGAGMVYQTSYQRSEINEMGIQAQQITTTQLTLQVGNSYVANVWNASGNFVTIDGTANKCRVIVTRLI